MFPFSPETKFPACIFHKAPGWWLFHEALWPASLRRGFCSWELDPQRLTKLQLQGGYYINVPKLKHYPFFFLFPETSSFSGFVRQTNLFPPAFKKQTLSHNQKKQPKPCLVLPFSRPLAGSGGRGQPPCAGSGLSAAHRLRSTSHSYAGPRPGRGSQSCCSSELPFPSRAAHVRGVRNAAALWTLSVGCPH